MSLLKDYFKLTLRHIREYGENTIVLIQVGAFFEVYAISFNLSDLLLDYNDSMQDNVFVNKIIVGSKIEALSDICELNIVPKQMSKFSKEDFQVISNIYYSFSENCIRNTNTNTKLSFENKEHKQCQILMAGFKENYLDKYVKKLQENGYTIPVYTQDNNFAKTTRSLLNVFSPGTYIPLDSDYANDKRLSNNIVCINMELRNTKDNYILSNGIKQKKNSNIIYIGISQIDIYTGDTNIMELELEYFHNPCCFDEVDNFITNFYPRELIIISNLTYKETRDIVGFINVEEILIHFIDLYNVDVKNTDINIQINRALNCGKQKYQYEILNKFYEINNLEVFMDYFISIPFATQSFCYLLEFVENHNQLLTKIINFPKKNNLKNRLVLGNHSLKQLNIIRNEDINGKNSCMLNLLNDCATIMGKREFKKILLNPITNIDTLEIEYSILEKITDTQENQEIDELINKLKILLKKIPDLSKINRTIILKKINPKTIYLLYNSLINISNIYELIFYKNSQSHFTLNELVEYINLKMIQYEKDKFIHDTNDLNINKINCEVKNKIHTINQFIRSHIKLDTIHSLDNISKTSDTIFHKGVNQKLDNYTDRLFQTEYKLEKIRNTFNSMITKFEKNNRKNIKSDEFIKIHESEKNNICLIATDRRCKILQNTLKQLCDNKNDTIHFDIENNGINEKYELPIHNIEYYKQGNTNKSISNPDISLLCKTITDIKSQYIQIIIDVYDEFIDNLKKYYLDIEYLIEFIIKIDILICKYSLIKQYHLKRPIIHKNTDENINQKSYLKIKGLRHLLIENIQKNEVYVSNDIVLGNTCFHDENHDFEEKTNEKETKTKTTLNNYEKNNMINYYTENKQDGILLYGTNAVGKTCLIKSIGISIIMAQSGLFVPASYFEFYPYKKIFTRIIGNDNIFKGLSTFAMEMSELRTILMNTDKNTLVLGDELCSGTENTSAKSIFTAGLKYLHDKESSFIFATHLHEIINYDEVKKLNRLHIYHMSVVYDTINDCLMYERKLQKGTGSKIYGIEVCKSLHLPSDFMDSVIKIAIKYNPEYSNTSDSKSTRYNNNKLRNKCEYCGNAFSTEVHHLIHQEDADKYGVIHFENSVFHKNHEANLLSVCEKCHNMIHNDELRYKKIKTTKGMKLINIEKNNNPPVRPCSSINKNKQKQKIIHINYNYDTSKYK